ncbi:cupin 2 conserved barrel domain protein [Amycolatopsis keratiniphila]|uniref:Cupin 2 conserved barrel domain protein n=2 Tax=Amycolatopsis keratiniphila TaxID=129921 RepID=R4T6D2_9PSEU|nr:cupin 2 conserved barrel domain protein [Amycolatopsis keratiniphila]
MYEGKQRAQFFAGISAESVGAKGLCMHLVTIPPGAVGEVHLHEEHETALFVLEGESTTYFGEGLTDSATVRAGEFLFIPAGVPHRAENNDPINPARAVLARTDPNEQESVVLLAADGSRRDDAG